MVTHTLHFFTWDKKKQQIVRKNLSTQSQSGGNDEQFVFNINDTNTLIPKFNEYIQNQSQQQAHTQTGGVLNELFFPHGIEKTLSVISLLGLASFTSSKTSKKLNT